MKCIEAIVYRTVPPGFNRYRVDGVHEYSAL